MITQIVTLIGVLVGALASFLATTMAAIEAAHEVNLALWQEEIATRNDGATPVGGDLIALMNRYHEQARVDLGVPRTAWPG
ncbi:hypothetical protein ACFCYH_02130 [Streptomyces sp. NPDC056400]|uniref:hypothetical protein n=1 Tax=Streptomyces sp. NPDC056400 TaxID=3345808 RepID=UPI0035D99CF2